VAVAALAASLLLGSVAAPARADVRLPSLGEGASADLSVSAERRLGDQIMREGRRDPAYLDDPVLLEYLQSLWQPLVEAGRRLGHIDADTESAFAWEAFLVRDRSVNAFAMPGGYIGVHLGLIALTTTADQLASVLAHELTHVSQRHIARSIAPQQNASMLALAAMILGMLAASRANNVDAANAAIMGGQAVAIQGQLNFSREMEREADRVGYTVLAAAGFSTAGMAQMFERMDAATRINDFGGFPYLRSHPLTVDRISEARNRNLFNGMPAAPPTLQHALMQAHARVLMDDSAQALQRLNGETSSALLTDRLQALYAGAMAASRLADPVRAHALAAQAMALARTASPREPAAERSITLLQAQISLAQRDTAGAAQWLDRLPAEQAGGRAVLLLRARTALDAHLAHGATGAGATSPVAARPADTAALRASTEALQSWVAVHAQDAAAWELLAGTSGALGLPLRAQRAGAEARAAVGDLNGAIDRLRSAQALARSGGPADFVDGSIIDTRLRQLTALRRELVLESRGER
jgi:predicted Zn-dependent protease